MLSCKKFAANFIEKKFLYDVWYGHGAGYSNIKSRHINSNSSIFDQWPKLHLGLDAPSNQKILKGI